MWGIHGDLGRRSYGIQNERSFGAPDRAKRMNAAAQIIKEKNYDFIMFQVRHINFSQIWAEQR